MPKKPKITDEQRASVAKLFARGMSIGAIKKETGLSESSINRVKPDLGAVFMKRTKTQEDRRIQRILRELRVTPKVFEESHYARLKAMARTNAKAAKVIELIDDRDKAMREGKHKNYNIAKSKADRISDPMKQAIIEACAERIEQGLENSSTE
jgi:transposase